MANLCCSCNGSGEKKCPRCGGSGEVYGNVNWTTKYTCSRCGGTGTEKCGVCGGSGTIDDDEHDN